MSLTNNEVKFLVTLDIDEVKSKKKIDSFLDTTIKDRKITFDVAVSKSTKKINEFLEKHKEKKANILFDVSVGKSNANITKYLTNRKQDTQSLIFYVNENATKAKINSALKKLDFQPVLLNLDVNYQESKRRINKFINEAKLNKKPIELIIAKQASITNLNAGIDGVMLNKAKVKLGLAKGALNHINDLVAKKEFKGATVVAGLDEVKTIAHITKQIASMKLPKFKAEVDVTPVASPTKTKATKTEKVTETKSKTTTQDDALYEGDRKKVYKQIKDEYKSLGQTVELFNKSRSEGEEQFIANLKRQGKQVDVIRNAQTQEITKITSTYKNSANEIQKDVFLPITKQFKEVGNSANGSINHIRGFVAEVTKLKNTETFGLNKEIDAFKKKLVEAKHTATANAKELAIFEQRAIGATSKNDIEKLTRDLKAHQSEIRKKNQLEKEQLGIKAQYEQMVANLTRIEKMYLRTVNKEQSANIKQMLDSIKSMKAVSASGKGLYSLNMGDIREAKEQISNTRSHIKKLNADATEATKNSMGIINSLKVAMEKFPINEYPSGSKTL